MIFPAAAWSENDGTFTNSERRGNRVWPASSPPGLAQPNWWIFKQIVTYSSPEAGTRFHIVMPAKAGIQYHFWIPAKNMPE